MNDATRYALSFAIAALATWLLTPVAARAGHRYGILDRPGGHKSHGIATPYLGGVAVAAGLLAIGAVAAGLSLWVVGVRAGVLGTAWVDLPVTVLWVVAVVNAFNFIDNMDGLAAGVAAASALGIASIAALEDDYLVASFAFAVAGASVGFLRYNLPPARIFLGDAGSMLLGFLVAALTLKLDLDVQPTITRLLTVVMLAGVPLFDLTLAVTARLLGRRPPWIGGTDHASHRLATKGRSRMRIAVTFAAAQVACSLLAMWIYAQSVQTAVAATTVVAATWLALLLTLLRLPHPQPAAADGR
jgi:UDP-GlcNAc:undecaprenyl-phosphate GlcNAc-1-phosphate transferase